MELKLIRASAGHYTLCNMVYSTFEVQKIRPEATVFLDPLNLALDLVALRQDRTAQAAQQIEALADQYVEADFHQRNCKCLCRHQAQSDHSAHTDPHSDRSPGSSCNGAPSRHRNTGRAVLGWAPPL